ncbi:MAG TPA: TlpA disulfide reductase family protein, partial [Aquabacterium sp.]|nr:TlpA disulfide reductase family protein [Aquabacterium sp.]
ELAARFLKQFNPTFPIVYDAEGHLAEKMKVAGMPTSMIFDRHGKVRFVHTGFRQDERVELESQISTLLR